MTTTDIIKSYPYVQFADDENITAWFDAYNTYAQQYLDWFNNTPLAVYTRSEISGALLDWVANGVYGCYRTPIAFGNSRSIGPLNTYTPNYIPFNQGKKLSDVTSFTMTDDVFKRVITWNFYKGDGVQISIPWLKKRAARFTNVPYKNILVSIGSGNIINLTVVGADFEIFNYLKSVMELKLVNLPISYSFTVTLIAKEVLDDDFGGDIV